MPDNEMFLFRRAALGRMRKSVSKKRKGPGGSQRQANREAPQESHRVLGKLEAVFSVWWRWVLSGRGGWSFEVSYLKSTKGGGQGMGWGDFSTFSIKGSNQDQHH